MKYAYVSVLVTTRELPSAEVIQSLDRALAKVVAKHEIVVCVPVQGSFHEGEFVSLHGPVTVVAVRSDVPIAIASLAGLGRTVGDLVIDWRGAPDALDQESIKRMLEPSNSGFDFVAIGEGSSLERPQQVHGGFISRLVRRLRCQQLPGRVLSRRAAQFALSESLGLDKSSISVFFSRFTATRITIPEREGRCVGNTGLPGWHDGRDRPRRLTWSQSWLTFTLLCSILFLALVVIVLPLNWALANADKHWEVQPLLYVFGSVASLSILYRTFSPNSSKVGNARPVTEAIVEVVVLAPRNTQT